MQFILTEEQQMLVEGVNGIVGRYGGPERARALAASKTSDDDLLNELASHGFLDVATDSTAGPLEAVLVVEAVTSGLGTCPVAATAVVGPLSGSTGAAESRPRVLATQQQLEAGVPVRFGATDSTVMVLEGEEVTVRSVRSADPVVRAWGYPLARVELGPVTSVLDVGASHVAAWWRVSVSAELVAGAAATLDLTLAYTRQREQFGRPLASFQALQHRMAQLLVTIEGARWLTYAAAWEGATTARSLLCAAQAVRAGRQTIRECHQFCGALGLTVEFDLHLWTMRISDLCAELGGPGSLLTDDGPTWADFEK